MLIIQCLYQYRSIKTLYIQSVYIYIMYIYIYWYILIHIVTYCYLLDSILLQTTLSLWSKPSAAPQVQCQRALWQRLWPPEETLRRRSEALNAVRSGGWNVRRFEDSLDFVWLFGEFLWIFMDVYSVYIFMNVYLFFSWILCYFYGF